MAKIPDFSELAKNLNLQGIVDNLKSVINPASAPIANPPTGDELATKFAEMHAIMQNLATMQAQQAKEIANANNKLEALFKDMQALRKANEPVEIAPEAKPAAPAEEKDKPE